MCFPLDGVNASFLAQSSNIRPDASSNVTSRSSRT